MGILNLARISCDSTTALHAAAHRRGGGYHHSLLGCFGTVPRFIHPELDVQVSRWAGLSEGFAVQRGLNADMLDILQKALSTPLLLLLA